VVTDQDSAMDALLSFSSALAAGSSIDDVLRNLAVLSAMALQVTAAGVVLVEDESIIAAASIDRATAPEHVQAASQQGPGVDAARTGLVVRVSDLRQVRDRWPSFTSSALEQDVVAVMSVPLRAAEAGIGALDLYAMAVRDWPDEDIAAAQTLANIAAAYMAYASELEQSRDVSMRLHDALSRRIVVEQAKGMVAAYRHISVQQALDVMRNYAVSHRASLLEIAEAIVGIGLRPLWNRHATRLSLQ
jgi:transcriptional regulator with GAF, ATPase, and Fis domain